MSNISLLYQECMAYIYINIENNDAKYKVDKSGQYIKANKSGYKVDISFFVDALLKISTFKGTFQDI